MLPSEKTPTPITATRLRFGYTALPPSLRRVSETSGTCLQRCLSFTIKRNERISQHRFVVRLGHKVLLGYSYKKFLIAICNVEIGGVSRLQLPKLVNPSVPVVINIYSKRLPENWLTWNVVLAKVTRYLERPMIPGKMVGKRSRDGSEQKTRKKKQTLKDSPKQWFWRVF